MSRSRRDPLAPSHAQLLARTPYRDADWVVQLFTREYGKVSAIARGARKSQRRFGGTLEAIHGLEVRLTDREDQELMDLTEASLVEPRQHLVSHLETLDAAGTALVWLRRFLPPRVPEPELYGTLQGLLNTLNRPDSTARARPFLAEAGLALLAGLGWALELQQCVGCRRICRPTQAALVDPARGGIVCRACGGASICLSGATRQQILAAMAGQRSVLGDCDADQVLDLVERTLSCHTR